MKNKFLIPLLVIGGVLLRLLPHAPNVAPIAAMALFAGTMFPMEYALLTVFATMMISDVFLGFYPGMGWVYGSYFLILMLGMIVKRKHLNVPSVIGLSLTSSLLFFLITNFGVWISTGMYAKNIGGLIECYYLAIPFFRNTILGDLAFNGVLFGGYATLETPTYVG